MITAILFSLISIVSFAQEGEVGTGSSSGELLYDLSFSSLRSSISQGQISGAATQAMAMGLGIGYRYPSFLIYGLDFSYRIHYDQSSDTDSIGNYSSQGITLIRPYLGATYANFTFKYFHLLLEEDYDFALEDTTGGTAGLRDMSGQVFEIGWSGFKPGWYFALIIENLSYDTWTHSSDGDTPIDNPYEFSSYGLVVRWTPNFSFSMAESTSL